MELQNIFIPYVEEEENTIKTSTILHDTIYDIEPVLTRYLYIKEDVVISMLNSLLNKRVDETMFWAYELYFSGFDDEVMAWTCQIYNDLFRKRNPIGLGRYIHTTYYKWMKNPENTHSLGNMIITLCNFPFAFSNDYLEKYPDIRRVLDESVTYLPEVETKRRHCIKLDENIIEKYYTVDFKNIKTREMALLNVKKYQPNLTWRFLLGEPLRNLTITRQIYENWAFYAVRSPYWKKIISLKTGVVDESTNRIKFVFPNSEIQFYKEWDSLIKASVPLYISAK
jgi:hypothetical protein